MKSINILTRKDIEGIIKEKIGYYLNPLWEKVYKLESRIRDLEKIMQNNAEQISKLKDMLMAGR